jgi:hypothetical protein
MQHARQSEPAQLSSRVHRLLETYSLAASAAGIGVLALARSAEARIVYTPANIHVIENGPAVLLDLNHDGITDFLLHAKFGGHPTYALLKIVQAQRANEIWDVSDGGVLCAALLPNGTRIGPTGQFHKDPAGGLDMGFYSFETHFCPWVNTQTYAHGYLGLKFEISGNTHYAWAHLKVHTVGGQIHALLTGYAYETIPNKPIIAGQTSGNDEDHPVSTPVAEPEPPPATLGLLALGSSSLAIWRREESAAARP